MADDPPGSSEPTTLTRRDGATAFERGVDAVHRFVLRLLRARVLEVEDAHFHHDSAVFLPDFGSQEPASREGDPDRLNGLVLLRTILFHARDNRAQKLFIAGHTDTSGGPVYNLELSRLRAGSVLHALLGNRDEWRDISHRKHKTEDVKQILLWVSQTKGWSTDPGTVDDVPNARMRTAVKELQKEYNLEFGKAIAEDGDVGRETWGAIFDLYMQELQNLCRVDAAGMAQLRSGLVFLDPARRTVGCGENHPIEGIGRPNFRSATDRRVEVLFFDPTEVPDLAACHPSATACEPDRCELYRLRLFGFEPIEPQAAAAVRLEVVVDQDGNQVADQTDPATTFGRVGLWDRAFDATTGNLRNAAGEADSFVGSDSRRLYFRVRDRAASGTVTIDWRTEFEGGGTDDAPASQALTLTETAAGSGVFTSKAVMIVADDVDAGQATDSGLAAGDTGARSRGQSNHRLRRITVNATHPLDHRVVAAYAPAGAAPIQASVTVFARSPEERRRLRLHLVNLRAAAGQPGVLVPAARDTRMERFRTIYAACGIVVDVDEILLTAPASCVGWATRFPGSALAAGADPSVESVVASGSNLAPSPTQSDVIRAVRALPSFDANDLYLVYARRIFRAPLPAPSATAQPQGGPGGVALPDAFLAADSIGRSFAFVSPLTTNELADVHEATHVTTNLRVAGAGGHFDLGAAAATAPGPIDGRNLMQRFVLINGLGVSNSKRLWNETFHNASRNVDIPPQIDAIRGSRFVRPF